MFSMERENYEFLSIPTILLRHEREKLHEVLEGTHDPHFLATVSVYMVRSSRLDRYKLIIFPLHTMKHKFCVASVQNFSSNLTIHCLNLNTSRLMMYSEIHSSFYRRTAHGSFIAQKSSARRKITW